MTTTKLAPARPRGMYETEYGNFARYTGGKYAYDIDMGERIPVEMLYKFVRPLDKD